MSAPALDLQAREQLGRLVARARAEQGLDQESLGRLSHLSRSTVQLVERARGPCPRRSTIKALGEALGIDLSRFMSAYDASPVPGEHLGAREDWEEPLDGRVGHA